MENISEWLKALFPRLIQRTKELIINPRGTWATIKGEETGWVTLLRSDLLVLAAFPSIAILLGWGNDNITGYLGKAVLLYGFYIGAVYGLSKLIVYLSPKFGATPDSDAAFKLVFYSFWPVFITGLLFVIRLFAVFTLVGYAYGLYLLWIGLPVLSDTPEEKQLTFRITALAGMLLTCYLIIVLTIAGIYPIIF